MTDVLLVEDEESVNRGIEFTLTDFPTVGLPKQDYNLNSTITDLRDNAVRTQ